MEIQAYVWKQTLITRKEYLLMCKIKWEVNMIVYSKNLIHQMVVKAFTLI